MCSQRHYILSGYHKDDGSIEYQYIDDLYGDERDVIYHVNGNIPEAGTTVRTQTIYNTEGGKRVGPGLFVSHNSVPGTVQVTDSPVEWALESLPKMTVKGSLLLFALIKNLGDDAGKAAIWTATKSKTALQNAFDHWKKHASEFPEFMNAKQYVEGARNFLHKSPKGTLTKTRPNGDVLKYHPETNTFGVMNSSGTPRTLFRPVDGVKYWSKQ